MVSCILPSVAPAWSRQAWFTTAWLDSVPGMGSSLPLSMLVIRALTWVTSCLTPSARLLEGLRLRLQENMDSPTLGHEARVDLVELVRGGLLDSAR